MRPAKVWEGLITEPICHQLEKMPQELIHMMLRSVERRDTASIERRITPFESLTPESLWT